MQRRSTWVLALLFAVACGGRGTPAPAPLPTPVAPSKDAPSADWITKLDREHPLVGKIWSARQGAMVEEPALLRELAGARFVLLGERHDNPDHHRLQARALEAPVKAGRKPAVVFEMLEVPQQPAIDAYRADAHATAAGFGAAVAWEKTSWPPYAEYQPIVEAAFAAGLRTLAGNLPHAEARALVKEGPSALPEAKRAELRLEQAFPAELEAPLLEELKASHCGHLPETLLAPMARAQHARDAQLARVLVGAGPDGAVLIAGSGHARLDRGVPYYLALDAPGAALVSIAFVEVAQGKADPQSYVDAKAPSPYHYLWFTPRASDEDPCAAFGKR